MSDYVYLLGGLSAGQTVAVIVIGIVIILGIVIWLVERSFNKNEVQDDGYPFVDVTPVSSYEWGDTSKVFSFPDKPLIDKKPRTFKVTKPLKATKPSKITRRKNRDRVIKRRTVKK